jgi:transcriptional regulator NrdR family protein
MSTCTECGKWGSKVLETRKLESGWLSRRRRCECGTVWWTYEIPVESVTINQGEEET